MQQACDTRLSDTQCDAFARDGFLVVRGMAPRERCRALLDEVERCLDPPLGPLELEAELGYPGAPAAVDATGGQTPRRLLHAYSRGPLFRDWARDPGVTDAVRALLGDAPIALVQAHHNCIMTKYPRYGSVTGWHQDVRYWSFAVPELVNVWLALGPEDQAQGGLRVIPGSQRMTFAPEQFDAALFLRDDLPANRTLLERAVDVELDCGDVLFFHSRLLHAAGRNQGERVKRSLVFTYNRQDNPPRPGSRSARLAQIPL
ncbi:MAG: phytanoyl-CoA dioxygenase family protein [Gammaproteobacteria bacterium]|nr:phytanoyl-CoA dioxygenase family protein [Gammaproteobacteria bacterium]